MQIPPGRLLQDYIFSYKFKGAMMPYSRFPLLREMTERSVLRVSYIKEYFFCFSGLLAPGIVSLPLILDCDSFIARIRCVLSGNGIAVLRMLVNGVPVGETYSVSNLEQAFLINERLGAGENISFELISIEGNPENLSAAVAVSPEALL